ncbi:hypothetical protein [Pedobacter sp. NJ-S-72]
MGFAGDEKKVNFLINGARTSGGNAAEAQTSLLEGTGTSAIAIS